MKITVNKCRRLAAKAAFLPEDWQEYKPIGEEGYPETRVCFENIENAAAGRYVIINNEVFMHLGFPKDDDEEFLIIPVPQISGGDLMKVDRWIISIQQATDPYKTSLFSKAMPMT